MKESIDFRLTVQGFYERIRDFKVWKIAVPECGQMENLDGVTSGLLGLNQHSPAVKLKFFYEIEILGTVLWMHVQSRIME